MHLVTVSEQLASTVVSTQEKLTPASLLGSIVRMQVLTHHDRSKETFFIHVHSDGPVLAFWSRMTDDNANIHPPVACCHT